MKTKTVKVAMDDNGDARPIAKLVQVASQYDASVYIDCDSKHVNAKSIMGMMTLNLNAGEEVTVIADGSDEEDAVAGMENFLLGNLQLS